MSEKPKCQVLGCDKNPAPSFDVCYQHLEGAFLGAFRTKQQQADLATRVAADLFARIVVQGVDLEKSNWEFYPDEKRYAEDAADVAVKCGRIFAEAVAKEGK